MSLHGKRKEIYKYEAPWTVYAMNWSVRPDKRFRLALGSFVEEYNNKVGRAGARNPAGGERAPGAPFLGRIKAKLLVTKNSSQRSWEEYCAPGLSRKAVEACAL